MKLKKVIEILKYPESFPESAQRTARILAYTYLEKYGDIINELAKGGTVVFKAKRSPVDAEG